ncbi:MAG: exodeoxyribonuclease VII small subunit [Oscillospiraceae bacterium]|nr:exodeoxyribonuclease VII small subunit [Oscillospiraceae bacterium]
MMEESFETLYNKLKYIVDEMEKKPLSLEENLKKYEEGMNISTELYKILSEAEAKIKILKEGKESNFDEGK